LTKINEDRLKASHNRWFSAFGGREEKSMSHRVTTSLAAVAMFATMCVATDALARPAGGGRGGGGAHVSGGGGNRGNVNVNRNVNVDVNRRGYGAAAVGAAAVGAAAYGAATYGAQCGYFPYPECY
jgi:hypothetical protein